MFMIFSGLSLVSTVVLYCFLFHFKNCLNYSVQSILFSIHCIAFATIFIEVIFNKL